MLKDKEERRKKKTMEKKKQVEWDGGCLDQLPSD